MEGTTEVEGTEPWKSAAQQLLDENGYRIRRWRTDIGGRAFNNVSNADEFEAPRPTTRISFAVFAHEVGHLKLHGNNGNYPRWREEIEAWDFALDCFQRFGLKGKNKTFGWTTRYVEYAIDKALRRGAQDVIPTLRREYPRWARRVPMT